MRPSKVKRFLRRSSIAYSKVLQIITAKITKNISLNAVEESRLKELILIYNLELFSKESESAFLYLSLQNKTKNKKEFRKIRDQRIKYELQSNCKILLSEAP